MGYDLYGVNPKNEKGEYFRNNCWYWRRLWQFVEIQCENILTNHEKEAGQWNNGWKIPKPQALRIAKKLKECLKNGKAEEFQTEVNKAIKKAKTHNKKLKNLAPLKKINKEDWNEHYPFTITNLKEFITFIENSGGFIIG